MRFKVPLVVCAEDGRKERVQEIVPLEKKHQRIGHLSLTLTGTKAILKTLQQSLLE